MYTQSFVFHVEFICPKCGNLNNQEIEVPEPNFATAEKRSNLTADGEVELCCSKCENCFEGDVQIGPYNCDITLNDYEDTMVSCDPPFYEELIEEWEIPERPKEMFDQNAKDLRNIIDNNATQSGGDTINRMIFTQIVTILEAYLCDNLIKGLINNPALLVSFSKKDSEISKRKISVSEVLRDSDVAKNLIVQSLINRVYHRFGRDKKKEEGVPHWYRSAFGFSLTPSPDDIKILREYAGLRHDCVHRNGKTKDEKKIDHINIAFLLEALTLAERIVEYIDCKMNDLA